MRSGANSYLHNYQPVTDTDTNITAATIYQVITMMGFKFSLSLSKHPSRRWTVVYVLFALMIVLQIVNLFAIKWHL